MELTGTIKKLFDVQQVSPTFRKREVVIETDENYPQVVMCEFTQDRADIPSRYREGDKVTVSINIRGREWTNRDGETKYFVSIQGWRMAPGDGSEGGGAPRSNDRGDRGNYGGGNDRGDRGGNDRGGDRGGNYGGGDRGGNRNQGGNFGGGDPIARAASSQAPGFDSSNDDDDLPF
jgi:single-strand DNA-binding protein